MDIVDRLTNLSDKMKKEYLEGKTFNNRSFGNSGHSVANIETVSSNVSKTTLLEFEPRF